MGVMWDFLLVVIDHVLIGYIIQIFCKQSHMLNLHMFFHGGNAIGFVVSSQIY